MTIFPAIDLKDGCCVRLRQGRANEAKVYGEDPVAMALHWVREGAEALHVVDLDGAFNGVPQHTEVIGRIVAAIDIPVQVGGGLRTDDDVAALLERGVWRAVIGTRALSQPEALESMVKRFGAALAVGIDARDGLVQVRGWVETTQTRAIDLAHTVAGHGVETIIYTDTATDGMLAGPNLEAVAAMCDAVSCRIVASGGVSSADDVAALKALNKVNIEGVIVGKALYEGRLRLADVLRASGGMDDAHA